MSGLVLDPPTSGDRGRLAAAGPMRGALTAQAPVTDEQWACIVAELTRRELIGGGLALGTLTFLGCGQDDDEGSDGAERSGYPRTIPHAYGSTTIERAPTRLVTLGFTDVDVALALGVTPVGFRDFFGTGLNPWAEPLVGTGDPEAIEYGERAPVERILALRPDLVVASTGMPRADYEALTGVVTTVGPGGDEATVVPWRTQVRQMARSLAREARAERLIDGLEARYAAARRAHRSSLAARSPGRSRPRAATRCTSARTRACRRSPSSGSACLRRSPSSTTARSRPC